MINKPTKEAINQYIFHFNPYTKKWAIVPREHYQAYFNGATDIPVVENEDISVLLTPFQK